MTGVPRAVLRVELAAIAVPRTRFNRFHAWDTRVIGFGLAVSASPGPRLEEQQKNQHSEQQRWSINIGDLGPFGPIHAIRFQLLSDTILGPWPFAV